MEGSKNLSCPRDRLGIGRTLDEYRMSKGYSEGTLVEQSAIELFAGPGWQTIGALDVSKPATEST